MSILNETGEEEYEIERIIDKRIRLNGEIEYKVKWKYYDEDQSTWEPIQYLNNAQEAIKDYENEIKENNNIYINNDNNKVVFFEKKNDKDSNFKNEINEKNNFENNEKNYNDYSYFNDNNILENEYNNNIEKINPMVMEKIILGNNINKKEKSNEKNKNYFIVEKLNNKAEKNLIRHKRKKKKKNIMNSFQTCSSSNFNEESSEENNNNNYEIIKIHTIGNLNGKNVALVEIKDEKDEKKDVIMLTRKIWDISPKILLKFYEDHISFIDNLNINI